MNMKVAILRNDLPEYSEKWELACRNKGIDYITVNMHRADWLEKIQNFNPNFCVSRPPGGTQHSKKLFDEKLFFLENLMAYPIFPGFNETFIYENKATLAWFLKTNQIPHPKTFVSSDLQESQKHVKDAVYPIVAKTLIGAAGSGVKIIKTRNEAMDYVIKAFKRGIKRRFGPNRKTGSPRNWFVKAVKSPPYFFKKMREYRNRNEDIQKSIVLFQEYIPHDYEWRLVKIGESYFGYKKLKIADQASGSKQFEYGEVPEKLLNFTKDLCGNHKFNFMAVDLFYNDGSIFVNELQTIFGHKSESICKVNGKPGRYRFLNQNWEFEEGMFNTNESYDLRLETAVELYLKDREA